MATTRRKVVIVGAGIAGLSAGVELSRSGQYEVIILEAMSTFGGRIQTLKGFGSHAIELGANWLHGTKGSPVYELAKKHDLLSMSDGSSSSCSSSSSISSSIFDDNEDAKWYKNNSAEENQYRTEAGECMNTKLVLQAKKMFADAMDKNVDSIHVSEVDMDQNTGDALAQGFAEELKHRGIVNDTKEYHQYWLIYKHCCSMECLDIGSNTLRDAQLKSYDNYKELEGGYYTTLGEEGYQGVLEKLLEDIPEGSILYNTPVERIQYADCNTRNGSVPQDDDDDDAVVTVTCEDGRTFRCSHVIMTASVGFLKENLETFFRPPLPEDKLGAIRTLPYGNVNKIFLKYKRPFWNSSDFGLQVLWDAPLPTKEESEEEKKEKFYRMLPGFDIEDRNDDILVGWTYGRGADYMETLTDEEIGQRCTAILRKFLNDPSIPEPEKVLCTRWKGNRYQRGAYGAFLPVQALGKEIEGIQRPVYSNRTRHGQKVPVLLFAGEAFHKTYFSTTHGAMVSGMDQAKVLINFSLVSK
eukprot:XP_797923.3 PREDICTED: peroxisomal N(1)-acetyl-spermine/spermidine oxidase [Strongylocentrotus purpuratus]